MKNKKTTTIIAAAAASLIGLASASAIHPNAAQPAAIPEAAPDTYGGCNIGGGGFRVSIGGRYGHSGYRGSYSGHSGYRSGSHYSYRGGSHSGYRSGGYYSGGGHYNSGQACYTTRCREINRCYFQQGCYRYARITYLHERVDSCGRVVSCWQTCRTVRC